MQKINKYIVIGPARSGTTVTHLILKGHPQVSALNDEVRIGELFGKGISAYTFGNDEQEEMAKGFRKAYDLLAFLNESPDTRAAGIKCAVGTVEEAKIFVERIKMYFPDVSIILTVREDLLAQYGSRIRARKTGKYHSWTKGNVKVPAAITVDKRLYSRYMLNNIEMIDVLRSLARTNRFLEISYEKDILSGLDYCNRLYDFLHLDPVEPVWVDSKKVASSPKNFIINYDSIKNAEKLILEKRQPLFSVKYFFYSFLKVAFNKTMNLRRQ